MRSTKTKIGVPRTKLGKTERQRWREKKKMESMEEEVPIDEEDVSVRNRLKKMSLPAAAISEIEDELGGGTEFEVRFRVNIMGRVIIKTNIKH